LRADELTKTGLCIFTMSKYLRILFYTVRDYSFNYIRFKRKWQRVGCTKDD